MTDIAISLVKDRADLKRFISVANKPYADDPNYVIPLMLERIDALAPEKNPYFEHADVAYFIAIRSGEDVGRISAQVDHNIQSGDKKGLGHFGCFEAMDQDVATALLDAAAQWLKEKGMTKMEGPWSLSSNQESGLLVDGFDTPPVVMMPHGRPEYAGWLEHWGLGKAKDLFVYRKDLQAEHSPRSARFEKMADNSKRLSFRKLNKKDYDREIRVVLDIFNDAWSNNWGYVPMTEKEIDHLATSLKPIVDPNKTFIYECDGEPAAFMVTIPDLNMYIAPLKGKILSLGIFKLIWKLLFSSRHNRCRVPLMGVAQKFQRSPLGAAMAISMSEKTRDFIYPNDCRFVEMGWILEDNPGMISMIDMMDGEQYKTYRVYEKTL